MSLFFSTPTYDGMRRNSVAITQLHLENRMLVMQRDTPCSLLTSNMNAAWAQMLNERREGRVTHFLLLHADVDPSNDRRWFSNLLDEMKRVEADVLSVVIPIKDARGITSTAVEDKTFWSPRRFTMHEVFGKLPTWTEPGLLVNTGCMLVDVRKPWVEKICFTINDAIIQFEGQFIHVVESEDWNFSRQAHALGAKLFATRKIPIVHWDGHTQYVNTFPWGTEKVDNQQLVLQE